MINVAKDWNPKQALLRILLSKPEKFIEAIKLCLEMHALVHVSEINSLNISTYEDKLWNGLNEEVFRKVPVKKNATIAWNLWHITRIEDMTSNIIINNDKQVFNDNWLKKLNVNIKDTGNTMTRKEIEDFSNNIDMFELKNYRIEVGMKTQKIISQLKPDDLKRKMKPDQINRIITEGGVLEIEGSKWLVDFWGKKTIAGILLMPITRHQIVHLNDSLKIKDKYSKIIN